MTDEEFEALVGRLERQAKRNPAGYRTRVLLMALLGNAYLGVMLVLIALLAVAAAISVVWLKAAGLKIAIALAVFLWVVVKALWVGLPPPQGNEITESEAPELFAMIEELRRVLRSPRFHHVLVTDDFNAAVVQAPRLGLFGWYRNYLIIGLPLAKALTVAQFKAVLAHEFGHQGPRPCVELDLSPAPALDPPDGDARGSRKLGLVPLPPVPALVRALL